MQYYYNIEVNPDFDKISFLFTQEDVKVEIKMTDEILEKLKAIGKIESPREVHERNLRVENRFYLYYDYPDTIIEDFEKVLAKYNLIDHREELLYICFFQMKIIKGMGYFDDLQQYYESERRAVELAKLLLLLLGNRSKITIKADKEQSLTITDKAVIDWLSKALLKEAKELNLPCFELNDAIFALFSNSSFEGDVSIENLRRIADKRPIEPKKLDNSNIALLCKPILIFLNGYTLMKAIGKYTDDQLKLLYDISKCFGLFNNKKEEKMFSTKPTFMRSILENN